VAVPVPGIFIGEMPVETKLEIKIEDIYL